MAFNRHSHHGYRLQWMTGGVLSMLMLTSVAFAQDPATAPGALGVTAFRTKHARFEPTAFSALPGWQEDRLVDAWAAFKQSCLALGKKPAWVVPCSRAVDVASGNDAAVRRFFEQEFDLFQIHNVENSPAGVITGYYEPQLSGSRRASASTPYPVYATPDDLLFLEAKWVPPGLDPAFRVRLEGQTVVPADPLVTSGKTYQLDLSGIAPDIRTRRYRLRLAGERIVPYLSRQEIERTPLARAKVIAWVDNRAALYSMQIQGSGKILLTNGEIIRVGYAEQNGHAFQPSVLASAQNVASGGASSRVRTRSLSGDTALPDDAPPLSKAEIMAPLSGTMPEPAVADAAPLTRGLSNPARRPVPASDVDRMIALLMQGAKGKPAPAAFPGAPAVPVPVAAATAPVTAPAPAPDSSAVVYDAISRPASVPLVDAVLPTPTPPVGVDAAGPAPAVQASGQVQAPSPPSPPGLETTVRPATAPAATLPTAAPTIVNGDPSYVFFREIPNSGNGPIGALGIPLTAGRSVAVDPRTTPLGFPVFISTRDPAGKQGLNRLMLAQDTGGAIRGAVRADYFWGFGDRAFVKASQMKEAGKMWLLLPKALRRSTPAEGVRVRGAGPAGPGLTECVVPDPELCAEVAVSQK